MNQQLSKEDVRRYETQLRSLLDSLSGRVRSVEEGALGASGAVHADREDEAVEEAALENELGVLASVEEQREAVSEALDRIAGGTFGVCTNCNKRIQRERLDIVPFASECVQCATKRAESEASEGA
jgi:DnaK suppressor protein